MYDKNKKSRRSSIRDQKLVISESFKKAFQYHEIFKKQIETAKKILQTGDYATTPFKIVARKGRFELTYIWDKNSKTHTEAL